MANTKNNQRFRDTEHRLETAAFELMETGERLTVRAVCERAQVNRSTFYAHFLDIPQMVGCMEAHLGEQLLGRYPRGRSDDEHAPSRPGREIGSRRMGSNVALDQIADADASEQAGGEVSPNATSFEFTAASYIPFLEHIREHRRFYRIALATRRDFPIQQGRKRMWYEVVVPHCQAAGITDEEQMMCTFVFYQAGFTMVLKRWVDGDCQTPVDRMARMLEACTPSIWMSTGLR